MEYLVVVLIHVLFGVIWAGGAIVAGWFILPAALAAGPGGGAVMAGVAQRKFPIFMTVTASLVVLSGLRLYMIRFTTGWVTSPEGIVLSLGALLALAAFGMGLFIQKPTVERIAALSAQIAASGAPPTPEQAAQLKALRDRLGSIARVTAWHLFAAALLMASHRLFAAL
jgi:uncharacterized membrane protein